MLFSLSVFLFLPVARVFAADLCEQPVAAICGPAAHAQSDLGVPVTADQIREESRISSDHVELTSLSGDRARDQDVFPKYRNYIGGIYKTILAHFAQNGILKKDIDARVLVIQDAVARSFLAARIGSAPPGPFSDAALAREVRSIKLLDPGAFAKMRANDGEVEVYYEFCGADGLSPQAFYDPEAYTFVICPGYLLQTLNSGSLDTLDLLVGHELRHSVDTRKDLSHGGVPLAGYPLYPRYASFLSCVQANYSDQMESTDRVVRELGEPAQARLRALVAELAAMPGDHSAEILSAQDGMRIAAGKVEQLKATQISLAQSLGHEPRPVDMHSGELTADFGGETALIELLKATGKTQRPKVIEDALSVFCPSTSNAARIAMFGPLTGDAVHPNDAFRVKNLLNNPEVRLLLGCKKLASPAPWCSVSEAAPVAARCDRSMGISSATECEDTLKAQLGTAGCGFSPFSCDPSDGREVDCVFQSLNCRLGPCSDRTRHDTLHIVDPPLSSVCVGPLGRNARTDSLGPELPSAAGALGR